MSTPGGAVPTARRLSGLALTGMALLAVLLAVVLVQARQYSLLRQTVQGPAEYSMVAVYQAEFEYQRLLHQWHAAVDDRLPLDERSLQLRYDIWVSRVALLQSGNVARLINSDAEDKATVEQAQQFIRRADSVLGGTAQQQAVSRQPMTRDFLAAELPALRALGTPIHAMTLNAADRVARTAEQRTQAVQEQNLLGLGLTIFLSLLTLAFAAVAMRSLERSRQRRYELEVLTQKLRQAQATAELASAAKSEFLAHMSHEVRTPFHGLMGMLSLLRETGLAPQQLAYLQTATESADHLLAVLNDILDLSQLESGKLRLALAPVDLRTVLRDVEALVRPQAMARGLSFHVDIAPDVPEVLRLDAMRVRQILFNLLSNALKFTQRGAVALDVHVRAHHAHARELEFCVSDTGDGLDAKALAALFDRSGKSLRLPGAEGQGSGLGLEISRKLARALDGDLTARSQLGQGSCFTLLLPLHEAAAKAPAVAPADGTSTGANRSLHVLVAEDHPINRECLHAMLSNLGHRTAFALDGQSAVATASREAFDLVLMDLHMPNMDGIAATRAIRGLHDTARSTVPIVALTADAFETTRDRCLVAGMNGFLTKPLKAEHLATTLRRLFGPLAPPTTDSKASAIASAAKEDMARPAPALSAQGAPVATPEAVAKDEAASNAPPAVEGPATAQAAVAVAPGQGLLVDSAAIGQLLQTLTRAQYAQLAKRYFEQAPHTARRLRAAMRDGQPLDLRTNAHAAKGAALNLGLSALATTAHALQQGAAHLPAHEIARLVQHFDDQTLATFEELKAQGLVEPVPAAIN